MKYLKIVIAVLLLSASVQLSKAEALLAIKPATALVQLPPPPPRPPLPHFRRRHHYYRHRRAHGGIHIHLPPPPPHPPLP